VDVLASLAREEEGDIALGRSETEVDARGMLEGLALREQLGGLRELLREIGVVGGDEREARGRSGVVGRLRRAGDEAEQLVPAGAAATGERATLGRHRAGVRAGENDEGRRRDVRAPRLLVADVLLERDVEVAAAEAEGADGSAAGMVVRADPGARPRGQLEGRLVELERRVRL